MDRIRRIEWIESPGTVGQVPDRDLIPGRIYRARGIVPTSTTNQALVNGFSRDFDSVSVVADRPIEPFGPPYWPDDLETFPVPPPAGFRYIFFEGVYKGVPQPHTAQVWFGPGATTADAWGEVANGVYQRLVGAESLEPPPLPEQPPTPPAPAPKKKSIAVPLIAGAVVLGAVFWGLS